MQGIVNRGHIDTGKHVLEGLTGGDTMLISRRLIRREHGGQDHQRKDEHLEQADTQHGGQISGGVGVVGEGIGVGVSGELNYREVRGCKDARGTRTKDRRDKGKKKKVRAS